MINVPVFYLRLYLEEQGRALPPLEDEDNFWIRVEAIELDEAKKWIRDRSRVGFDKYAMKRSAATLRPLLNAVVSLPRGARAADRYHKMVARLLTNLFYPSLAHPRIEHRINKGRKRIDITFTNEARIGFFAWLGSYYNAPHIFIECKNYVNSPGNPELDQLSGRFSTNRGHFGMLVCRSFRDKPDLIDSCRDTANDQRGFIIPLADSDLKTLVKALGTGDAGNQFSVLKERFDKLVA